MALNSSGPISLGGTTAGVSIEKELGGSGTTQISLNCATVRTLAGVPSGAITMPTNFYGKSSIVVGSQSYTTPGTYSWTAPTGVTKVSVVVIGGGASGGGGGGLAWRNCICVTPGSSYTVVVGAGASAYYVAGGQSYFCSTGVIYACGGGSGTPSCGGNFGGYTGGGGKGGKRLCASYGVKSLLEVKL